jgi:phosphate transport system protein
MLGGTVSLERHEHIVSAYEQNLSSLNNKIAKMGGLAELVVGQSLEALEKRDKALAESTIKQDEAIDRLEAEIEHDVGVIIVKRQPVAYDLRQVMAPFRIAIDLERIGDLGKNIAKRTVATGSEAPPGRLMLDLKHMGQLALVQLKEVLVAFMERDADHALKVWYKDESIDTTFNTVFRKLITYMMETRRTSSCALISYSPLRTLSASAITRPTSPKPYIFWSMAQRSTTDGPRLTPQIYP